jgi:hypothetical protein
MYVIYRSHNDATLSSMEDTLCDVHTLNDVFLLGPAGKKAKAKTNARKTELVKKRQLDKEPNAET